MSGPWLPKSKLGKQIRDIRVERLGMTQPEFVAALERPASDQGALSMWETGKAYPPDKIMTKIAGLAGLPVTAFMNLPDTENAERRDMLIGAKWMEKMAAELRERAKSPVDAVVGVGKRDNVLRAKAESKRKKRAAPRKKRGRGRPDDR